MNRYFIVDSNDTNVFKLPIVEDINNLRYSLNEEQAVIKLHKGDNKTYFALIKYTEYTHSEILVIVNGSDWRNDILKEI